MEWKIKWRHSEKWNKNQYDNFKYLAEYNSKDTDRNIIVKISARTHGSSSAHPSTIPSPNLAFIWSQLQWLPISALNRHRLSWPISRRFAALMTPTMTLSPIVRWRRWRENGECAVCYMRSKITRSTVWCGRQYFYTNTTNKVSKPNSNSEIG